MADPIERWHVTERGALLYGDETGGITVAGLAVWKDSPERTVAIRALARWCDEAIDLRTAAQNTLTAWDAKWAALDDASTKWGPEGTSGQTEAAVAVARTTSAMNGAMGGLRATLAGGGTSAEPGDDAWLRGCIADELRDYLPDAIAYQWASPVAATLVDRLPHVFAGQLTAPAIADAIDEAQRRCTDTHPTLTPEHLAALAAGVAELVRAAAGSPPPTPGPTREQADALRSRILEAITPYWDDPDEIHDPLGNAASAATDAVYAALLSTQSATPVIEHDDQCERRSQQ